MRVKWLIATQVVVTLMTGVVLLVSPALIPASFGLTLTPDAFVLCYFYGAAELALSSISLVALRTDDGPILRSLCTYFVVYQLGQALVGLYAITQGAPGKVAGNSLAHLVIALLFSLYAFSRPKPEPSIHALQGREP